ncbi:hypothetical protein G6F50_014430 [Rhizopus delemar]|uniref:Uncharacterized protein n=1 Tax=Rhizopus delemar TaxID=936053 RepID=A0A9P6Y5G7_9FUNG|nr:hypothetical protein G6F50_014430 [Rhizopus delemar]
MLLGVVDEFLQGLHRQLGGVDDHHLRRLGHQGDGHEILLDVVVQALVQRRGQRVVRAAHEEGIAVGPRLGGHACANRAARPALVVDDDGLAQRLGRFGRDRSCQDVGRAAGRMRHHERDGFGGEGLRVRRRQCRRQTGGQRNARQQSGTEHGSLLGCC